VCCFFLPNVSVYKYGFGAFTKHLLVDILGKCWRLRNLKCNYVAKFLITCVSVTCPGDSLNLCLIFPVRRLMRFWVLVQLLQVDYRRFVQFFNKFKISVVVLSKSFVVCFDVCIILNACTKNIIPYFWYYRSSIIDQVTLTYAILKLAPFLFFKIFLCNTKAFRNESKRIEKLYNIMQATHTDGQKYTCRKKIINVVFIYGIYLTAYYYDSFMNNYYGHGLL
jgi:hypothetical protein